MLPRCHGLYSPSEREPNTLAHIRKLLTQRMLPPDGKMQPWSLAGGEKVTCFFYVSVLSSVCGGAIFHMANQECNRVKTKVSPSRQANVFLRAVYKIVTTVQEHRGTKQRAMSSAAPHVNIPARLQSHGRLKEWNCI